jgi:hypothetical protein
MIGTQMLSLRLLSKLSDSRITGGTVGFVTTALPSAASVGASIVDTNANSGVSSEGNMIAASRKPSTIVKARPISSTRSGSQGCD